MFHNESETRYFWPNSQISSYYWCVFISFFFFLIIYIIPLFQIVHKILFNGIVLIEVFIYLSAVYLSIAQSLVLYILQSMLRYIVQFLLLRRHTKYTT